MADEYCYYCGHNKAAHQRLSGWCEQCDEKRDSPRCALFIPPPVGIFGPKPDDSAMTARSMRHVGPYVGWTAGQMRAAGFQIEPEIIDERKLIQREDGRYAFEAWTEIKVDWKIILNEPDHGVERRRFKGMEGLTGP